MFVFVIARLSSCGATQGPSEGDPQKRKRMFLFAVKNGYHSNKEDWSKVPDDTLTWSA